MPLHHPTDGKLPPDHKPGFWLIVNPISPCTAIFSRKGVVSYYDVFPGFDE